MGQDGLDGAGWEVRLRGVSQALSLGPSAHLQPLIRVCKCWGSEMWTDFRPTGVSGVALAVTHFLLQLRTAVTAPERGR